MAKLNNKHTDETILLLPTHVFGRQAVTCNTVLLNREASRIHANIVWDGEHWLLRDSSSNGTFLNRERLLRPTALQIGDVIQFGGAQVDYWEVIDTCHPFSALVPLSPGLQVIELTGMQALPSDNCPQVILVPTIDGRWLCESETGIAELKSGDLVGVENAIWRFIAAQPSLATFFEESLPALPVVPALEFKVSQNEEHVSLIINYNQQKIKLGERSHHYLIVTLARKRLSDEQKGIADAECGWINKDELCQMLGIDLNHINIHLFRFRKQLIEALPNSPALLQIIDARLGQVRLSDVTIHIAGGQPLLGTTPN
jgi:hypothetical protein